jgi:DNA mismatch repair ATPase MutS
MNIYQTNILKYKALITALEKDSSTLSTLRLVAFIFSFIIITILANERQFIPTLLIVPLCVGGFLALIKRHSKVDHLKQYNSFLKEINEAEVLRQDNKLSGFPTGESFLTRNHSYVSDLDVFGSHSLFAMINRTTTKSGNERLAEWLSEPANNDVILERQQAVQELSPNVEWRQHFQASGMDFIHTKNDFDKLIAWVEKPIKLLPRQSLYLIVSILLSVLSTAAAVYFLSHVLTIIAIEEIVPYVTPLIIALLVNNLILRSVKSASEQITENLRHHIKILAGYQSLVSKIEGEKFLSTKLQQLQSTLIHNDYSAANEINKLKGVLEVFQVKGGRHEFNNFFYAAFNSLWFLDVYLVLLTEKWKSKNGTKLKTWASAVSEFEVLSSLAGFHYSNPSFTFPAITSEPYRIEFEMLGHPLIDEGKRVCNDFSLNDRGEIAMITGSNMAGKSTFLRSVGINLVLALMGAPCCAKAGRVSNIKVFSSMRTQDNLEEGVSSFYAELKRVEQLLKLIESGESIFFLLDEMFKGTNSKDRHRGGFSLIKQLKELNAFGIISTHDLDLADLAGRHQLVTNYSFNSGILNSEMIFNYKLTNGLCQDFNASELMKKSGIKILTEIEV